MDWNFRNRADIFCASPSWFLLTAIFRILECQQRFRRHLYNHTDVALRAGSRQLIVQLNILEHAPQANKAFTSICACGYFSGSRR